MIATYASVLAVSASSLLVGGAVMRLCGRFEWSWLAPGVGLAALCVIAWGTVRLPGGGATAAAVVLLAAIASGLYLARSVPGLGTAARAAAPVGAVALLATSLPFIAEGHFGILGTGFNPDMSQHLLASSRLSDGTDSQLLIQGYPLGPHAIAVALHDGLGVGLVQAFTGLTVAVTVLACLTALAVFDRLRAVPRVAACLLVGAPYMVASYFAQGAFKETIMALLLLAFVLALRELRSGPRAAVPLAVLGAGAIYSYSFPGLVWLAGAGIVWAVLELVWANEPRAARRRAATPGLVALGALLILTLPEIGRLADFREFETFDPAGAGLGNLFGQISPFEGLGIWPSGDFRLTPGDGAVPAAGYYLGVAFALALLLYGLWWCVRQRQSAVIAGVAAAVSIYLLARATGTAYQGAKAIELVAPVAALAIVIPFTGDPATQRRPLDRSSVRLAAAIAFALAAGLCSALAFANAPLGPEDYSPRLTELRPLTARTPTLILAPRTLLDDEHGEDYLNWELRGGRLCVGEAGRAGASIPPGVGFVISPADRGRPFPGLTRDRGAGPWTLWRVTAPVAGESPCPLIAVRSARQGRG